MLSDAQKAGSHEFNLLVKTLALVDEVLAQNQQAPTDRQLNERMLHDTDARHP